MDIRVDSVTEPAVIDLLEEHLDDMQATSPPESVHALDLDALRANNMTVWTAWRNDYLMGMIALKRINHDHGEIKSMRTPKASRGNGAGKLLVGHLLREAAQIGYKKLSLETGSMNFFKPAHALYRQFGFVECDPFADYRPDSNSVFMTIELKAQQR
jgi:putative acetyltransferase